jgi:hypothetical protein
VAEELAIRCAAVVGSAKIIEELEEGSMDDARVLVKDTFDDIATVARWYYADDESKDKIKSVREYELSLNEQELYAFSAKAGSLKRATDNEINSIQQAKEYIVANL